MDFFTTFIIAFIEGATEFLPISSTGHMIAMSHLLGITQSEIQKSFEISIQLGAILAIVFLYKEKISLRRINLWWKIFLAFLPVAVVGLLFADYIKMMFSIEVVAVMFILGGIALLFAEKIYNKNKKNNITTTDKISTKQSLIIGLFQILSLIPGTSRAGSTIFGAMFLGINRKVSAEFSFLLAIPVMLAVFFYEFFETIQFLNQKNIIFFFSGFFVSFITAYLSIKLFVKFLEKFTLFSFGIYRIFFGLTLLLFFV